MVLKSRKGSVEISFNWIFSLIAGVLILSFLIYFSINNTDLFGRVTSRVVLEEMDVLLSGIETTQTNTILDFGNKVELRFFCDDEKQRFTVNGREGKNFWGKIAFSPKRMESDKIYVGSNSWKVPFRVANFIFLSDKKYRFSGAPDSKILDSFSDSNGKFVAFQQGNGNCNGNVGKKIYYSKDPSLNDYYGTVCFENKESRFYGEAMMIGAVLSDTKEDFDCAKNLADKKLNVMKEVYKNKANEMIASSEDISKCKPLTGGQPGYTQLKNTYLNSLSSNVNINDIRLIENANRNLINGGCAGVF